ncbi:TonB-dependent receptor, plug domain containing protein [Spirosomataceae bacterium]
MKKSNFFLFTIFSLPIFLLLNDPFSDLAEKFRLYSFNSYEEKVYLHLDRSFYSSGETIWFKANLANGITLQPDTISVPLYVELVDTRKSLIVVRNIIKLTSGFGSGHLVVPDSINAGNYQVRAYTKWMRNFGEDAFFQKNIRIVDSNEPSRVVEDDKVFDFQFFPEGGHLVNGLASRLAFKATDIHGKGIDIEGVILKKSGDTLVNFSTRHFGMGFCMFTPDMAEEYEVNVYHKNVLFKKVQLPSIQKSGYTILVDNLSNSKNVKVYITKPNDLPAEKVGVMAQTRGEIYYAGQVMMSQNTILLNIPKDKLPQGTAQITLFNEKGDPQCERLVYMHLNQMATAAVKSNKAFYGQREKVTLEIQANSFDGKPLEGDFSLAVTDAFQIKNQVNEGTILSHLTLSSDVNGVVEQPGHYFDKSNTNAPIQLDILMLTQGWRRFKWESVVKKEEIKTPYLFEKGLGISGEVRTYSGKKLEKPFDLSLVINDDASEGGFMMGATDDKGRFEFIGLDYSDNAEILIQLMTEKSKKNTSFLIDSLVPPKIKESKIPYIFELPQTQEFENYLKRVEETQKLYKKRLALEQSLNEVVIKGKKIDVVRNSKVLYRKEDASTLSVSEDTRFQGYSDIFQVIRGRIPGVTISGDPTNPSVVIRGVSSISLSSDPLYLIDGQPVDKSQMLNMLVTEVDEIDVLKGPAVASLYGDKARNGVISVLTRAGSGKYGQEVEAEGVKVVRKTGYQKAREFYQPNYDQDKLGGAPDYRTTVYWNPSIKTNKDGKASVTFYTTDASTLLKVQLEGLSYEGEPTVGKVQFEVR